MIPKRPVLVLKRHKLALRIPARATVRFSWWIASSSIDATYCSFRFFRAKALVAPMAASLPAIGIAAVMGAWPYKE
jgi:hypothetical protein